MDDATSEHELTVVNQSPNPLHHVPIPSEREVVKGLPRPPANRFRDHTSVEKIRAGIEDKI